MASLEEKIRGWVKPLRLEKKQGCANRSVVGGLDRFITRQAEALLSDPALTGGDPESAELLRKFHRQFSQYLALSKEERNDLLDRSLKDLSERPVEGLPEPGTPPPQGRLRLDSPLEPLVPREKLRAFRLTQLKTVEDLLYFSPKWALHRSNLTPLGKCEGEGPCFFKARINGMSEARRGPREILKVNLEDGTGRLAWIWFNRPFLKKEMVNGRWVVLHDTPQVSKWGKQVTGRSESYEFLTEEEARKLEEGGVVPLYPSTPTLGQDFWKTLVAGALEKAEFPETDPEITLAFRRIHQPGSLLEFEEGRRRLAFEQLLTLQTFLILKRRRMESRRKGRIYRFDGERVLKFRKSVPYQLTPSQKRVLKEIREDLAKPHPMNRLLQGDVGSGKTLVAAVSFLYAADSGVQSALLVPTEILAHQHFQTLEKLLKPVGLRAALLTADMRAKEKRETLSALEKGEVDLAIGTHALLEKEVKFKDIGFLVIDERHKFGVLQRAALEEKGRWPDVLMMTATPFPRALVLTEYGDTDLSLLTEFPKGRKPIRTFWKGDGKREEVYQFIRESVLKGDQAYVVYPAVDESKAFLKSAVQMHRHFQAETFHGFRVGLLHGKMRKEEKERVMRAFAGREIQILVSTTVVEVGVDVSNATVIAVEHAERFGLAQLHQLRGRVGRGEKQATCFLLTSPLLSGDAVERMKTLVSTLDGFKLSEADLRMRGPGEIFGVAQSGRKEGGIVDLRKDGDIVEAARARAGEILAGDLGLQLPENSSLRRVLESKYRDQLYLAKIS